MMKKLIVFLFCLGLMQTSAESKSLNINNKASRVIEQGVSGKVTDNKGIGIIGVSVLIKGSNKGTVTDANGNYNIPTLNENSILVFSSVGFISQEINVANRTTIDVSLLVNDKELDEVVVTGVFDARTRLESSNAISIMKTRDIERVAATSAADYLKNISGVFVNAGMGEVRNQITTRGLISTAGGQSYNYLSMQEDGLPITNINYGVDLYLRPDATTSRIEVLRGGSASITGANAPGGIFNYISKTGGEVLTSEVRAKFGLEGDGKNPFYRADFNVGGPLSQDKSWRFNIGGFYRVSDGPRYAGYTANNGGQFKANITKTYNNGSLKVYVKYLNDHNQINAQTPLTNWSEQVLPTGFSYTASYDIPSIQGKIYRNGTLIDYDSEKKHHSTENNIGISWNHSLADGLEFRYNGRYSSKTYFHQGTTIVAPFIPTQNIFYILPGLAGRFGTYTFTDKVTGQVLGTFDRQPGKPIVAGANNNFPGFNNQVLFMPAFMSERPSSDFMNQATISKRFKKMSFIAGIFQANTKQDATGVNTGSGPGAATIQDKPHMIDIKLAALDGKTYQVTSPEGFMKVDEAGQNTANVEQKMFSAFFGHDWSITDKLNLDWGLRYESVVNSGWNAVTVPINTTDVLTFGGYDNSPLTLYDNFGGAPAAKINYSKNIAYLAVSAGLNYKLTDKQAIYFRYSNGGKSPDINALYQLNNQFAADNTSEKDLTQKIEQIEFAYKYSSKTFKLFITPFISNLENVASIQFFRNIDNTAYAPPVIFNSYTTKGVEFETDIKLTKHFSVKASALFQESSATKFEAWIANANGPQDDTKLNFTGNKTGGMPPLTLNIAPTFSTDKFFATLSYNHLSKRPANTPNGFEMNGYNNMDFSTGYGFNKNLSLQFNINNVLNQFGILAWQGSGGFPTSQNLDRITKEYVAANPNDTFSGLTNLPRAFYLTASYKF